MQVSLFRRIRDGDRSGSRCVIATALFGPLPGAGDQVLQSFDFLFPAFAGDWSSIDDASISRSLEQRTVRFGRRLWSRRRGRGSRLRLRGHSLCLGGLRRRPGGNDRWRGRCRFRCGARVTVLAAALDNHVNAFFIFLDDRQSAAGGLQQSSEFGFDEAILLFRIAHVAERRAHVKRAADLAFVKNVVAAQMNFRRLAGSAQLLQVAVAEFFLFIPLVADSLSVRNPLWHRGCRCWRSPGSFGGVR